MGIFDFDNSKPRVTSDEFHKKVRNELYTKGFTHKELDQLEGIFGGDMNEGQHREKGIDASEIDRGVKWLRDNQHSHTFSEKQIDEIDAHMKKHL